MIEDSYLIILAIIIVILFIALIVLTYKLFELQQRVSNGNLQTIRKETQPPTQKEQPKEKNPAEPVQTVVQGINLTEGISDINESMKRYTQKYNLDSATLASMDGFSIASSHAESETEAANLTARYRENAMTKIGDIHIIPLNYRGEDILVIFRTDKQIPREQEDMMIRDGRSILSHWI